MKVKNPGNTSLNQIQLLLLLALLAGSFLLHLGKSPFYLEEPRRVLIAQEMLLEGQWLVPTQMGEIYRHKPPFFNWLLMAAFIISGAASEPAARLVTVFSLFAWGLLSFIFLRKHASFEVAFYASLFLLVSADLYFYFSLLAEIDIFYGFVTCLSFYAAFHFKQKNALLPLFISVYLLNAIGFLTKGFPSLIFPVFILLVLFYPSTERKKLFSWQHAAGIFVFVFVAGGYFFLYSKQQDAMLYLEALLKQSGDRTVLQHESFRLLKHLFVFPVTLLKDLLPATLLLPFILKKNAFKKLWENELTRYLFLLFAINIVIYWLSPGTRTRYVYMLFPLPVILITFLFFSEKPTGFLQKFTFYFRKLMLAAGVLSTVMAVAIPLYFNLNALIIIPGVALSMVFLFLHFRLQPNLPLMLIAVMLLSRWCFDLWILPVRAETGEHVQVKKDAEKIVEFTKGESLFLFRHKKSDNYPLGSVFYIGRDRQEVLRRKFEINCHDFFIVEKNEVAQEQYIAHHAFAWKKFEYLLVKFSGCE